MALMKCPDCGKMVSSRASSCPDCGCPASYFISDESGDLQGKADKDYSKLSLNNQNDNVKITNKQDDEEMIKFNIGNNILKYPKGSEVYAELFGRYLELADVAYNNMLDLYKQAGGIGKALRVLPDKANEIIANVINECMRALYENGVNITPEQFLDKYDSKYTMDYNRFYNVTLEKYSEILDKKSELAAYRAATKASRGKWQGYGFGVKGAIKGAMTASALNMGSDFLHSFGDTSKEKSDNKLIQGKLSSLYKQSEGQLCHSVKTCIMNIYKAMCDELVRIDFFNATINLQKKEAETLYDTTRNYETDPKIIQNNMIQCIYYYPGDKRYYAKLKDKILNNEIQLDEFLKFWHLEYLIEDITKQRDDIIQEQNEIKAFEKYFEESVPDYDFNNFSAENAAILLGIQTHYNGKIHKKGELAGKIEKYFKEIFNSEAITNPVIFTCVPSNINIHDFLYIMQDIEDTIGTIAIKMFAIYGKGYNIPNKLQNKINEGKDVLLLYCDTSITELGSKGMAITLKSVYDLKTMSTISISEIRNIEVTSDTGKIGLKFSTGTEEIYFPNLYDRKLAIYVKNVITLLFVRYYGNKHLPIIEELIKESDETELSLDINTEDAQIYRKNIVDYCNRHQTEIDLYFSNKFRRKIKLYNGLSFGKDKNIIYKYDYEVDDESITKIIGEDLGQYILWFDGNNILLTDQNIYMCGNRYALTTIQEILFFKNMQKDEIYILFLALNDKIETFTLEFKRNNSIHRVVEILSTLFLTINVALEGLRQEGRHLHYTDEEVFLCGKCNSIEVKMKMFGMQCEKCGNSKFELFYKKFPDHVNGTYFKRRCMLAPDLSTKEERSLLAEEDINFNLIKEIIKEEDFQDITIKDIQQESIISTENKNVQNQALVELNQIKTPKNLNDLKIEEKGNKMFCTNCGKQIMRNAKFCNFCGKTNNYAN